VDDGRDPRSREDGAVFAPARVRTTRGPRLLAACVAIALSGLVAIAALDRLTGPDQPSSRATARDAAAAVPSSPVARASRAPATPKERSQRFTNGPEIEPRPGSAQVLLLDLRPAGSHLFVHGDVFSLAIVRVSVALEDGGGSLVAARESVGIPGGSTAFRIGAVPRFDVQFSVPDEVMGEGMWVAVTAYNAAGRALATLRQLVPRTLDVM
jgi:hypothetical protein